MSALAKLQEDIARAIVAGGEAAITTALVGGASPDRRLQIHQRHYEASLTASLMAKFPACAWLVGTSGVTNAARAYVHAYPPERPCIAEYGSAFPAFLGTFRGAEEVPYLESFAALEWAVGQVSIATECPALAWPVFAAVGGDRLFDCTLTLQPGLRYLKAAWRVDEVMELHLGGQPPERFVLAEVDTYIEVRGGRGAFSCRRLDSATCRFRQSLVAGRTIGIAASEALDRDAGFDAGVALQSVVAEDLVTQVSDSLEAKA